MLVFQSHRDLNIVVRAFHLQQTSPDDEDIELFAEFDGNVNDATLSFTPFSTMGGINLKACVPRVYGGVLHHFLAWCDAIYDHFPREDFFYVMGKFNLDHNVQRGRGIHLNPTFDMLCEKLGYTPTNVECTRHRVWLVTDVVQQQQQEDLTPPLPDVYEDPDFQQAVAESLAIYEPQSNRIEICDAWKRILREDDQQEAVDGDPLCIVCKEMVATIVFVDCQHQACCDECCKTLFSIQGLNKCPTCRAEVNQIVRPFVCERASKKLKT